MGPVPRISVSQGFESPLRSSVSKPGVRGVARHAVGLRVAVVAAALLLLLPAAVVILAEGLQGACEALAITTMGRDVVRYGRSDLPAFLGTGHAPGMEAELAGASGFPGTVIAASTGAGSALL